MVVYINGFLGIGNGVYDGGGAGERSKDGGYCARDGMHRVVETCHWACFALSQSACVALHRFEVCGWQKCEGMDSVVEDLSRIIVVRSC